MMLGASSTRTGAHNPHEKWTVDQSFPVGFLFFIFQVCSEKERHHTWFCFFHLPGFIFCTRLLFTSLLSSGVSIWHDLASLQCCLSMLTQCHKVYDSFIFRKLKLRPNGAFSLKFFAKHFEERHCLLSNWKNVILSLKFKLFENVDTNRTTPSLPSASWSRSDVLQHQMSMNTVVQ